MKKFLFFILIFMFSISFSAVAQEKTIILSSPEEIEQFKKYIKKNTFSIEDNTAVENSSVTVSSTTLIQKYEAESSCSTVQAVNIEAPDIETSSSSKKDIQIQPVSESSDTIIKKISDDKTQSQPVNLTPAAPAGVFILRSKDEIKAFNERMSALGAEVYEINTSTDSEPEPQKK